MQPTLATPRIRHAARTSGELDNLINEWTKTIALEPLEALLTDHGVPCGLIYKAQDMIDDPHFKARQAIVEVQPS